MELIFFYFFASLAVLCSLLVVSFRNTLSSALALVLALFSVACLYILLNAAFVSVLQILVYAGAIMVLFVFVIMLMNLGGQDLRRIKITFGGMVGILFGAYLAVILSLRLGSLKMDFPPVSEGYGSIREVGQVLFTDYLIPFELTSLLLLTAVVGAILFTKKEA